MAAHDVLLGLPLVGNANKGELRTFLVKRVPYTLTDAEAPSTFIALVTGAIPNAIGWHRTWFWYDPLGAITSVDNVTVISTQDGYIYKADSSDLDIHSVMDRNLATPPGSPAVGDTYLVAAGATGAWAGKSNYLALYTERGWVLVAPRVGDWVLVEDEDVYVRYKPDGTWVTGQGSAGYGANSIPWSALINVDPLSIENQTTNTPPGSPVVPVAYIIGGAPTGVWTGHARKIAKCELNGSWTIYTPLDGQRAYDKTLDAWYQWFAATSAWVTATGGFTISIVHYGGSATFSKHARCIGVLVTLVGGGGGSSGAVGNVGGTGGTSSFGAHLSATGGSGGTSTWGGIGGGGFGGGVNLYGQDGGFIPAATANNLQLMRALAPFGSAERGAGGRISNSNGIGYGGDNTYGVGGGGAGGGAQRWLNDADLAASETVTVAAGGAAGASSGIFGGEAGQSGHVVTIQFIEA